MALKKKIGGIKLYVGIYDVSDVMGGDANSSKVLTIAQSAEDKAEIQLVVDAEKTSTATYVFTGFAGKSLKLALINIAANLDTDITGDSYPENWADSVVGFGSKLFKEAPKIENVSVKIASPSETNKINEILGAVDGGVIDAEELSEASTYYQQVQGTDNKSRYVYVASKGIIKLAMRIRTNINSPKMKISLRAMSSNGATFNSKELVLLGLTSAGSSHVSTHFQCDEESFERFLAFFNGCLVGWEVCAMNVEKIKGGSV